MPTHQISSNAVDTNPSGKSRFNKAVYSAAYKGERMAFADYTLRDSVAVITLNNPPVHALSRGLRAAIADGMERAANDASVAAVVIAGTGSAFCGGADVGEFGLPAMSASPSLADLFALIENSPKPVVAGINGLALAGIGTCDGVSLPGRGGVGAARNARSQAGPAARRRGHAAAAAPGGRRTGVEHDRQRQFRERTRIDEY